MSQVFHPARRRQTQTYRVRGGRAPDREHLCRRETHPPGTRLASKVVGTGEAWLTELSNAELRDVFALRKEAVKE